MIYSTMVPNIVELNTLTFHKDRTINKFVNLLIPENKFFKFSLQLTVHSSCKIQSFYCYYCL